MGLLQILIGFFTSLWPSERRIPSHIKQQAYGPRWSKHRRRQIGGYTRKQPCRGWW